MGLFSRRPAPVAVIETAPESVWQLFGGEPDIAPGYHMHDDGCDGDEVTPAGRRRAPNARTGPGADGSAHARARDCSRSEGVQARWQ